MKVILIVGIVLLISAYFAYPIVRALRVSRDIEKDTVAYEQHSNQATMSILVVGDSTGVGTGSQTPQGSIAGRIGNDIPTADIVNHSENGLTLAELSAKLAALPEQHYDLMVIQIGANDVTGFTSKEDVLKHLSSILDYANAHASSTVLLTAGDIGSAPAFRAPLSWLITSRTLQVRDIFTEEAKHYSSVTYIDLYKTPENNVFNTDPKKFYARDGFHPSSEGYGVWYEDVKRALKDFQ